MDAQTLLLDSLEARWKKFRAELKICGTEFSEGAVHDARVSARRLLSTLDLLRSILREPRIQKLRRILKGQLDDLDDLRDIQVLLADISESIHDLPALKPFREYLQDKEKRFLRRARKDIKSLGISGLSKRLQKIHESIGGLTQPDLETRLLATVDEIFTTVNQRYALIEPSQPATIHRLRIKFKKFRYILECIHPLLVNFPEEIFKRMQDYHNLMGDIQDMEISLQQLVEFTETASSFDPEPVRQFYEKRHSEALSRYIEDKGELMTFWRAAPDQSFPWEK